MISIFTIPKPFRGHNRIIQRNAIKSWMQLEPQCEIILIGDDDDGGGGGGGVAKTAYEFGVKHVPSVEKNVFGTPLLSSAFSSAQNLAKNNILMYANADVIFFQDLIEEVQRIDKPSFLLCGRRWDLDVREEIRFGGDDWNNHLLKKLKNEGRLHGFSGMDYFIFPRNTINMPAFAVGRPGWDSWLIYHMRSRGISVLDATEAITVIHQNHDFSHSEFGGKIRVGGPEFYSNIKIAGGLTHMLTLRDADWILDKDGLRRPKGLRRIFSVLAGFCSWRLILSFKRRLHERMASSNW